MWWKPAASRQSGTANGTGNFGAGISPPIRPMLAGAAASIGASSGDRDRGAPQAGKPTLHSGKQLLKPQSSANRALRVTAPMHRWPIVAVFVAAAIWTALIGSLAVQRHELLRSNAFDLGYFVQTLWNTAH